ncbi:MAG: SPASM domain-containing protein [Deltaproteobacteria bacterium]|nr:SPASM domain-containing protein [Deltaproteobacteria bacterium]
MQVSRFNYLVSSPKEEGVHFLYNSLHDNRIVVEDGEVKIQELLEKVRLKRSLNQEESEIALGLKDLGYLLDDHVDEKKLFNQWMKEKVVEQAEVLTVTVTTTMSCNLRCTYCFEKDQLGKARMSPETMDKTVEWIKERLASMGAKRLNLLFFGGEPLLNIEAIKRISGVLNVYCRDKGIEFSSGAITNGIFLTPTLVDQLKEWGLSWVKITFDGNEESHDKRRIYRGGKGTFKRIFDNLEAVSGRLKICIGGNFDQETVFSFKGLIDKLAHSKFKDDITYTNFKPISPAMVEKGGESNACSKCVYKDQEIKDMLELRDYSTKQSLPSSGLNDLGICEFYNRHSLVIGVGGELYKCSAFVGQSSTVIGSLESQEYNQLGNQMLSVSKPFETEGCRDCSFNPVCGGGCRADAYNSLGSIEKVSCQKQLIESTVSSFFNEDCQGDTILN